MNFFEAVQDALTTYACSLGPEPWFYTAAAFAAAGQGIPATAATVGGVATALGCGNPPGLPPAPGPTPNPTYDSGDQGVLTWFSLQYEGTYTTWNNSPAVAPDGCKTPLTLPYSITLPRSIRTRQLQLYFGVYDSTPRAPCGTVMFSGFIKTFETPTWQPLANYTVTGWSHSIRLWAWPDDDPKPPTPPEPPDLPPRIVNINYEVNNVSTTNEIQIDTPDFIFAPSGDFTLSFPVTVRSGPNVSFPFSFNFDLNYSTGGSPNGGGSYGNKPTGSGPKLPPEDRPSECPEIPEDPQISGSWSKADCINGETLFTPVDWSGKGVEGIADALNKLNSVIGPWQEETYDCNDELPMEPLFGIPVSEYRGVINFEPSITLYFYEPNLLAIEAGRTNRIRRRITIPVAIPPTDANAFLAAEALFWEGYEWQCGLTNCRARLELGRGFIVCQAINSTEGLSVLQAVFNRYGQVLDPVNGFRQSTGSAPTDSGGRGGLRVQTTVRFHCCSFATQNQQYGPVYPATVLSRGPGKRA